MLVCGGDMNVKLSKMDGSKMDTAQPKSLIRKINSILEETGILDVWRDFYPS